MTHFAIRFRGSLWWTIGCAFAAVVLGDILFFQKEQFAGYFGVYELAVLALLLLARSAVRRDRRALLAMAAAAIFAGAMILDANVLAWILFWVAAGMATLLPSVARFDDGWRWAQRLVLLGLRALVAPLLDLQRARKVHAHASERDVGLRRGLAALALPICGSIIVLMLFTTANPVLDRFMASLFSIDIGRFSPIRVVLWAVLFIMAWGLLHPRPTQRLLGTFDGTGDLDIPGVSVASVRLSLIAFNLLFAMQNLMDIAFMGGLARLPDGMTFAEYAHRGAYPLIATALLAAVFVLVTLRPGSRTAGVPAIRAMVILWVVQNVVLVASSILRTLDYVDAYSLTPLRIAALVWMLLVALGLVLICWRMLTGRSASWLINANMAAAAIVLSVASFVDLGAVSAWWNIRHAREVGGRGAALDLCYLNQLGGSALLPLLALERRTDLPQLFRARVQYVRAEVMKGVEGHLKHGGWTWLGQHRLEDAQHALGSMPSLRIAQGRRNCDGSLIPPPPRVVVTPAVPLPRLPDNAVEPALAPKPALTAEKQP
jgi:hypothetical protein